MTLLTLHSLATWQPPLRAQDSLLGSALPGTYFHLFDAAGAASRPPTVRRGLSTLACPPYEVPVADPAGNVAQLACGAVDALLTGQAALKPRIGLALHAQCTLNQQILGSSCLRVVHEHLPQVARSFSVGQLGTAGLPVALRLAALQLADGAPAGLACLSASDKWIAPFFRRTPGVVTFGDAAAACLVGRGDGPGVARIEGLACVFEPPAADPWTATPETAREQLVRLATQAVQGLALPPGAAPWLAGDRCDAAVCRAVAQRTGLAPLDEPDAGPAWHAGSAEPLFAIARGVAAAARSGRPVELVVWTASSAGAAGALHVRCDPAAQAGGGAWRPAAPPTSPAPSTRSPS
ncbi:MAG: hypothetical protein KIT35_26830 [Piscinibacter sp.]|uniref:hypothetical protein n=1 Tax=Piscinibacter TaxID=1114981 RepID=UPI000FDF3C50|nr:MULTISPECIES: hypothetical protein [Piscinibacter]MCW5667466.1 hypothetical protein [Piscinibacter sp.]